MTLSGKKALVTGAAGGIGQAIVRALTDAGAAIAATDIQLEGIPCDVAILGDLTDSAHCDALPAKTREALGGLDIVINNAGIIRRGVITDSTDDDYVQSMAVNVEAPFRICRAAIPILAANGGGAIVNVSSCWGVRPGPNHPLYCMSKAALASMTQCLGHDHAHQGIRVNAVCPNEVNTPMLRSGFSARGIDPEKAIDDLNRSVPLGHIAQPEEIADVVLFLVSDQSRYMCGALVEVNGGKPVT
ncbi:MAG TPA: SDR family oxidoreductase [Gammaproteobacteria bacterium]|jgi:NAD(P)-dependent dehydrogenase (short-subunit alcohol dehydrogenase family)|nr:SDR family oxidoreductase [Gammaproteobacteria bacterium]PHS05636.1 MAG: short-chain dehydrogenase [Acidithiobacillus sp.]RTZ63546.1 MAG: short-chain dehydrogenase [Gammaproteobacteria bacterium]HAD35561.1 short-chain dehydrogenase [Gammaproteobacteria bacterium]HBK75563.1 short-chain dehydrogenase [Gammaproteobacteria bacterium]